ncbi:MAG: spore coat protein U domain-containing protein [Alphaproteobacteria bacterium]|nr:spore coat protein U domain-containing protein [Alphaproteobacteria bacterium]
MKYRSLASAAIALGTLAFGHDAGAATQTTTFAISATVANSCSVNATNLDFGSNITTFASNIDQTTTVGVTCTNGGTYDVGLTSATSTGQGTGTGTGTGTSGANTVNYQLFQDSARSVPWGDTSTNLQHTQTGCTASASPYCTGTGTAQSFTVYGQIPGGQTSTPVVGTYSDTVTVTVTF